MFKFIYLNVFNTHRLGIVEIYEKIERGESGVGGNREKQRGPSLLRKYDYVTNYADRQFIVMKNIKKGYIKSEQLVS